MLPTDGAKFTGPYFSKETFLNILDGGGSCYLVVVDFHTSNELHAYFIEYPVDSKRVIIKDEMLDPKSDDLKLNSTGKFQKIIFALFDKKNMLFLTEI